MLRLHVVTPEREFLQEECLAVTLPGKKGQVQILPGHTPCLLQLKTGHVILQNKDQSSTRFMIASGFLEVDKDQVNVMCELATASDEVNKETELDSKQKLEQQIKDLDINDRSEHKRLKAELEKNVARLNLLE